MTEAGQCEAGAGAEEECGRGLNKWSLALVSRFITLRQSSSTIHIIHIFPSDDNMDSQEFKVRGRQMVDYIIQYLEVSLDTRIFGGYKSGGFMLA